MFSHPLPFTELGMGAIFPNRRTDFQIGKGLVFLRELEAEGARAYVFPFSPFLAPILLWKAPKLRSLKNAAKFADTLLECRKVI
jgi:hypothetical protein